MTEQQHTSPIDCAMTLMAERGWKINIDIDLSSDSIVAIAELARLQRDSFKNALSWVMNTPEFHELIIQESVKEESEQKERQL